MRPTKFKPEYVEQAAKLCALGATDIELADFFEVDVRTLYRWKNEHDGFCQALKFGKEAADARIERSLYERAAGYERDEVDIRVVGGEIVQTPIRKHYPPDTTACIFWLKNRRADLWRDKTEQDVNLKRTPATMSDAELAEIAAGKAIDRAKSKSGRRNPA